MTEKEFVSYIGALAAEDMKKTGILASITAAQAILESGYGSSELARNANNLFGMKANLSGNTWPFDWGGQTYTKETGEQKPNGERYTITAAFRKYADHAASIKDHSDYLAGAKNGSTLRYEGIVGERDYTTAAKIIKGGGYATSIDYVSKLCNIIEKWNLTQYDQKEGEETVAKRITLDAGHYGNYNRSPVKKTYYESRMNWSLHLKLKAALEKYGFEVVTTRSDVEKDRALVERGKAAKGSVFFISIHSNACGTESVDYPVAYGYVDDAANKIDDVSRDLGGLLAEVVEDTMGTRQDGRVATRKASCDRNGDGRLNDEYYGVLHGAKNVNVPGIILEHSFHTNTAATNWLSSEANLQKLAEAEAAVIAEYFGMKAGSGSEEAPAPAEEMYRVRKTWNDATSQIGAYRILENAKKACKEGYSVFNSKGEAVYTVSKEQAPEKAGLPYKVRVDIDDLNIRKGPGTNYGKRKYTGKGVFTIVAEADGPGASKWGLLKSYQNGRDGWISLDFAYKI